MSGKKYDDEQNQEENYMGEDISMTQEELADDVRWEDSPGVLLSMDAKPLTAKRGPSVAMKNIPKKPTRKLKGGSKSTSITSIDDIIGMLGKRKESETTTSQEADGLETDKENALLYNSQDQRCKSRRGEDNDETESSETLTAGTVDSIATLDQEITTEPGALERSKDNENARAVESALEATSLATSLPAQRSHSSQDNSITAMNRTHTAMDQQEPAYEPTQTWGMDSGSSTRGFGYVSGTGTARPTPAEQSRAILGASGSHAAATTHPLYAPVLTRAPSIPLQPIMTRAPSLQSVKPATHQPSSQVQSAQHVQRHGQLPQSGQSMYGNQSVSLQATTSAQVVSSTTSIALSSTHNHNQTYASTTGYSKPLAPANIPLNSTQGVPSGQHQITKSHNSATAVAAMHLSQTIPVHGYGYGQHSGRYPVITPQPLHSLTPTAVRPALNQHAVPQPELYSNKTHFTATATVAVPNAPNVMASLPPSASLYAAPVPPPMSQQHEEVILSEEALAQLFALEQSVVEQELQLSEADLAHLLELEQAFERSQQPMAASQCADVMLSEDVMAQLLELERNAYAEMPPSTIPAPIRVPSAIQTASNATSTLHLAPQSVISSSASVSTGELKVMAGALSAVPPLLCMRLVVLDVVDDTHRRMREVRAFQPGSEGGPSQSNVQNKFSESSFDTFLTVELFGDWYNCQLVSGDVFHVVDLGPDSVAASSVSPQKSIFSGLKSGNKIMITDQRGLVITHPDILVSPTKIAESCNCIRRGVLTDRIRSFGDIAAPAVLGNLKHAFIEALTEKILQLLQSAPDPRVFSVNEVQGALTQVTIMELIADAKRSLLEDLYLVGCTDETVRVELWALVQPVTVWVCEMYHQGVMHAMNRSNNNNNNTQNNRNSCARPPNDKNSPKTQGAVSDDYFLRSVSSCEETVWAAVLGMKGQVDLVATARWAEMPTQLSAAAVHVMQERALPVEIKTGKWRPGTVLGHRAQVILYVLMMTVRDRSGASIVSNDRPAIPKHGVIVYINAEETKVDLIKPSWLEMCALVASRNKLATYIRDAGLGASSNGTGKTSLPPMLRSAFDCSYCYQAAECMASHAALEGGSAATSGVPELYSFILTDITAAQLRYFKHWDDLLALEATATLGVNLPWAGSHSGRGNADKSLVGLTFQSCQSLGAAEATSPGNNYLLTFSREISKADEASKLQSLLASEESPSASLTMASLAVNDRVHVSVETDEAGVGRFLGTPRSDNAASYADIEDIGLDGFRTSSRALMFTDPNICSGHIELISADEVCIVVSDEPKRLNKLYAQITGSSKGKRPTWKFRLDKDEISINITTMRSNLLALFAEPFNPKKFQAHKASQNALHKANSFPAMSQTPHDNSGSNTAGRVGYRTTSTSSLHSLSSVSTTESSTASLSSSSEPSLPVRSKHWRALIVDLVAPSFRAPGNLQEDMLLMKPAGMVPAVFHQALKMLYQYLQLGNNASLELTKQQLLQMGIDPPSSHLQLNTNNAPVLCVSKGRAGELNIFGGLTVYPGCIPFALCTEFHSLNPGQAAAVLKILLAEDYALLLGLPGTGKTSTLSLVVRMMIARGQKVLLTSFTNSAVDHLMLKLVEAGMTTAQVMRIGSKNSVHPSAQKFVLDSRLEGCSLDSLHKHCESVRLVACTVLTASRNQLVRRMAFDCCVMDEAGQIAQPAALGAVLAARTCVLVGDDYQLPPLVVSIEAQGKGMNVSLFKRFMEAHPSAVCSLTAQYRMNQDIMSICNVLIYEHRMQCALPSVANAKIQIPHPQLVPLPLLAAGRGGHPAVQAARTDWLHSSLQPHSSVVFLNTDNLACNLAALLGGPTNSSLSASTADGLRGNSVSSNAEAGIVRLLVTALIATKYDLKNVGVICPFRAQVELISSTLKSSLDEAVLKDCEVSTVDKYQGRDKEVIILSTVKSCADGKDSVGNLLRDWRRINVAITRAKHKLIVIGSFSIMQHVPVLQQFTQVSQQRNWTLDLPPNALDMY